MDWLVNTPFRVNERGFLLRVGEGLKVFIPIRINIVRSHMKIQQWSCLSCSAILLEPEGEPRSPCPNCGGTSRRAEESLHDGMQFFDHMRMVGKHGGRSKPVFDSRVGASFYYKKGEWHHIERTIDRDADRYIETITLMSTGEVIRHVDEPLSRHTGRGSAKRGPCGGVT